jgi:NAD(P)H-dependent FMN reductase
MNGRILVVSASLVADSRSRALANAAFRLLDERDDVDSKWLDLVDLDLQLFPRSEADPRLESIKAEFASANGLVLSCPIYNWGASAALMNLLHYVLHTGQGHRYQPFLLLGSAGTPRSHLALGELGRALLHEIAGIQVGPPVIADATDIDAQEGRLTAPLIVRLTMALDALVSHAKVSIEACQPTSV